MDASIVPALTHALGPHVGRPLTPEVAAQVTAQVALTCYPGPVDISRLAPRACGSYTLATERLSQITGEMVVLHRAHWDETESHRNGTQPFAPDYAGMIDFEQRGRHVLFTARAEDGTLVGNCGMYLYPSLHTRELCAQEDTLFVLKEHRRGRLGVALIKYTEDMLALLGVRELTVTVKLVNSVGPMLARMGYQHVAAEYVKQF